MEVITHDAGDVVELHLPVMSRTAAFGTNWSGRWMQVNFTDAIENTVAVVHMAGSQGLDQCIGSISSQ